MRQSAAKTEGKSLGTAKRMLSGLGLFAGAVLPLAGPTVAQDTHYWNDQYGTRAQLLGGLVVGSFLDLSATFYNPGALAVLDEPRLEIGTNTWEYIRITATGLVEEDLEFSSDRVRAAPSLFAFALPSVGKSRFAISVLTRYGFELVTDGNRILTLEDVATGESAARSLEGIVRAKLSETWAGFSWALELGDQTGVGVTTYAAIRTEQFRTQVSETIVAADLSSSAFGLTDEFRYTNVRLLAKLGFVWGRGPLSLGTTLTTPSLNVFGGGRVFFERRLQDYVLPGQSEAFTLLEASRQDDLPATHKSPLSMAGGGRYETGNTGFSLGLEWFNSVGLYTAVDGETFVGQTTGREIDMDRTHAARSVLNYGVGADHELSPGVQLYLAAFTDRSSLPPAPERGDLGATSWDIYHVSAGSAFTVGLADLTVGLSYGFGSDRTTTLLGIDETADLNYTGLRLLLGFSTDFSGGGSEN